ncbi:hypothetical protein ACFCZ1_26135 [Streptomyces sp. NPDC056224]|uniref:hypothetical protein n=1 Tax=Streptomyces sp. NPDC056224 TaxID=3345750 RepID=UPI0035E16360
MAAPIVVHRPSPSGGRRVTAHGQILGLAHNDRDLIEFLRRAGLEGTGDFDRAYTALAVSVITDSSGRSPLTPFRGLKGAI